MTESITAMIREEATTLGILRGGPDDATRIAFLLAEQTHLDEDCAADDIASHSRCGATASRLASLLSVGGATEVAEELSDAVEAATSRSGRGSGTLFEVSRPGHQFLIVAYRGRAEVLQSWAAQFSIFQCLKQPKHYEAAEIGNHLRSLDSDDAQKELFYGRCLPPHHPEALPPSCKSSPLLADEPMRNNIRTCLSTGVAAYNRLKPAAADPITIVSEA